MKLRKYETDDWNEVVRLFYNTVHSINSADYNDAQLDAWAPDDLNLLELEKRLATNYSVVVEKDGVIVGFGNVHGEGYFDCLYTHKDFQRLGVATIIADDIENHFKREESITVTTDASITAKPFFEKRGYKEVKEQDVECRGQYLINYRMQKDLIRNDHGTGWERNKRTHFDEIVVAYDRVRWEYPNELYDDIFSYSKPANGKCAVEIGSGTGISTAPFLNAGYEVTAVEMGANMTEYLIEKFKDNQRFKVITSTFEDTAFEDCSFDLVYAASAFHWVDAKVGCPKVFQMLKEGGTFALFRNNAKTPSGNRLYDESQEQYERYYYSYYSKSKTPKRTQKEDYKTRSGIYDGFRFESMEQYGFNNVTMKFYETSRSYSADDYITLLDTYSDHRSLPDENRSALYKGIRATIIRYGGYQKLNFLFQLYIGKKP